MTINKQEKTGFKYFIANSNGMDNVYKNIEEWNPNKKRKILIVLDYMNDGMLSIKNLNPIVTVLFIKGKTLKTSLVIITKSYFVIPKNIRRNSTHHFNMKIPN